jgi:hypothetical protein
VAKQVKINPNDIDVTDLANILAKAIAEATTSGVSKGMKDAAKGAKDLTNELKEQLKDGKSRLEQLKFNADVQTRALQDQISGERAAVKIMAERQIGENDLLIMKHKQIAAEIEQNMQIALRTDNTESLLRMQDELLAKQNDIAGLVASNNEIRQLADEMDHVLHQQEERNELMEKELEHAEELKKIGEETKELLGSTGKFIDTMKAIFTDSTVAAGIFIGKLNQMREAVIEGYAEIREEGFTITQSLGKVTQNVGVYFSTWGVGFKEAMEAQKGLVEALGSTSEATADVIGNAAQLGKTFGISEVAAGQLTGQFMNMPGATGETANNTLEFAGNLATAAHVAPGKVMAEIAASSEDVALYSKDSGKNIAVAAVAAKKLGMEFGSLTKMADQLLDFESSINKQMEASVLLGKEINLDKAREAALNGDLVTMTNEVLANVGGEAEYNKMNAIQRKALADSLGVSVQDLGKMIKNQDKLNDLTEEQQQALASGEASMDEILSSTSGFLGKMKDGVILVGSFVKGFSEMKQASKDTLSSVLGLFKGMAGGQGLMGKLKGGFKGALGLGGEDKAMDVATKAQKVPKGAPGIKKTLQDIATGIKSFGNAQVIKGAGGLALSALALVTMTAALPALAVLSIPGLGEAFKMNAKAIAGGIKALGSPALIKAAAIASLVIGMFGIALIPLTYALSLLAPVIEAFGNVVLKVFEGMSILVKSVAESFVMIFQAFADNWQILIPVGIGLAAVGVGLTALGASAWFAAPGLLLAGAGLMAMVPGLALVQSIANTDALTNLSVNLIGLGAAGPALMMVGSALMLMGAGLSVMALAGFAALPIIGALIGLAAVAPALTALGDMFGMGGGEEEEAGGKEEDKMQILIDEIRGLRTEMSKGGVVNMDGKKVGETLRLAMNTSGVR